MPFMDKRNLYLTLKPGTEEVVWGQDLIKTWKFIIQLPINWKNLVENLSEIDLEELISNDVDQYFETYVEELSHSNAYRKLFLMIYGN